MQSARKLHRELKITEPYELWIKAIKQKYKKNVQWRVRKDRVINKYLSCNLIDVELIAEIVDQLKLIKWHTVQDVKRK